MDIFSFNFSYLLLICCCILLVLNTICIFFSKDLLSNTVFLTVFSIIIALIYLLTDAPDVAMTEVALGSCLSTTVLLNIIKKFVPTTNDNLLPLKKKYSNHYQFLFTLLLIIIFIALLLKPLFALPQCGSVNSPMVIGASKYYLANTKTDIGIKSTIAAILADYRGFDTLGETIVILIAGLGVLLILTNEKTGNDKVRKFSNN